MSYDLTYQQCPSCKGEGEIPITTQDNKGNYIEPTIECPVCNGEKKILKEEDEEYEDPRDNQLTDDDNHIHDIDMGAK